MSAPPDRPSPPAPAPRPLVGWIALLALGGLALVVYRGGHLRLDSAAREQDSERSLRQAAQRLARTEPSFFADFEPYTLDELERAATSASSAEPGPAPVHPSGSVLSTTPAFLWRTVEGARTYRVTLRDESGASLWSHVSASAQLAWPGDAAPLLRELPLTWEVEVEGGASARGQAPFRVASERDVRSWQRRLDMLAAAVADDGTRGMFTAQLALRRGHVWEAWEALRRHRARYPRDPYAQAFERVLRSVHGLHE